MVSGHRPRFLSMATLGMAAALASVVERRPVTVRRREPEAAEPAPQPMTLPPLEATPREPVPMTAAEIRAEAKLARKNARRLATPGA